MPIKWQINQFQQTDSTQDLAHDAAKDGADEGAVFQALKQNAGRGRHGNQWSAPLGNLYLSFVLRPDYGLDKAGQVSFVVACALARALELYMNTAKHELKLKWPNDVLVDGLKISGILLESNIENNKLDSLIVGIGVNIFNKPDLAICLNDIASDPVYVNIVRDQILHEFNVFYTLWRKDGFAPIREFWQDYAYGMGADMTARLPNEKFKGAFGGINDEGALILIEANGDERIINAAEVHFSVANPQAEGQDGTGKIVKD